MCSVTDWTGCVGNVVNGVLGNTFEELAQSLLVGLANALGQMSSLWVRVPTPNLTDDGDTSTLGDGAIPPGTGSVLEVMGYVTWIGFAVAVLALIILGARIASGMRRGEGMASVGRMGIILGGVILISSAVGIVSMVVGTGPNNASGAVGFIQGSLWWYMVAAAVTAIVVGSIRMMWEQRAQPGKDLVRGMLTLVIVAGAGTAIVGGLVAAADMFSVAVLQASLDCDPVIDSACFGENVADMLGLLMGFEVTGSTAPPPSPLIPILGAALLAILAFVALLFTIVQVLLMVARGAMLVILVGILPLSASFTNTEMGATWFKRSLGWLIAFILYKPAAAIVYAASFQLVGSGAYEEEKEGVDLVSIIAGMMLMLMALVALPALMRFVTPMVAPMAAAGGAGMMLAGGAAAAIPSGAAAASRLAGSGSSMGKTGSGGPQGNDGGQGKHSPPGGGGSTGGPVGGPSGGSPAKVGAAVSAGGGAAAGATAGAAGGPVGMAAGAASSEVIGKVSEGAKKGAQAVQSAANEATGSEER